MIQQPLVTIGIPTYNRSKFLKEALSSALNQSYRNIEVIVSDNGSIDNTPEMLLSFKDNRLHIIRYEVNSGMVFNFNSCLRAAKGEYFLMLSDDDILEPTAIEKLVSGFISTAIAVSYGPVSYIGNNEYLRDKLSYSYTAPEIELGSDLIYNILKYKRVVYPCAAMFKTNEANAKGCYPDIGTATDFALLILLSINKSIHFGSEPIAKYRIHSEALSFSDEAILSITDLLNWLNMNALAQKKIENECKKYCKNQMFNWGKHQVLIGNRAGSLLAESLLNRYFPSLRWKVLFLAYRSLRTVIFTLKMKKYLLKS